MASQVDIGNAIDPNVFTSWRKLIRVTASLGRLAEKICSRRNKLGGREGPVTPEELAKAEMLWIRSAQRSLQRRLENDEFKTLSPFVDGKVNSATLSITPDLNWSLMMESYTSSTSGSRFNLLIWPFMRDKLFTEFASLFPRQLN